MRRRYLLALSLVLLGYSADGPAPAAAPGVPQPASSVVATPGAGSTTTRLADGRLLVVGGEGTEELAWLEDANTGQRSRIQGPLAPRAWHSATLLADGTVLVAGGRRGHALVDVPEIFSPATGTFASVPIVGALARASHSATLLLDGRVLVAGGTDGGGTGLPLEIWNLQTHTASTIASASIARQGHRATLLGDGRVLIAGGDLLDGSPAADALAIDPVSGAVGAVTAPDQETPPAVTASIPSPDAIGVPVDVHVALRFSTPIASASITTATLALSGPDGPVPSRIVVAEGGRLAFVWPAVPLAEGTTYTLAIAGATDVAGTPIAATSLAFTTIESPPSEAADTEPWTPGPEALQNGWRANRPPSPWESLAPLMAPPGVTAVSGRVLTLDGRPLPDVTLRVDGAAVRSDRTGRFLLLTPDASAGRHVLAIDGKSASRPGRRYGFFEYGTSISPGQTNVLPFTIWMPVLDLRHQVTIPSPTTSEVVITSPYIPALEVHLPPGTTITDDDGNVVHELGITPIPVDRPPFPLATNVDVPVYFTVQPGSSYVHVAGSGYSGAWVVYPNYRHDVPGQLFQFFHYDPDQLDWYVYGTGTVTADGRQVMPKANTRIQEFTGAMFNGGGSPSPTGTPPAGPGRQDPIDPATGLFVMHKTDLYLPDVIPLALTRTYQSGDNIARPFGIAMTHPYAMFLWSAQQYQQVDLILPEGGRIHYVRTSPGTGWTDAIMTQTGSPTAFNGSIITWNGHGWNLQLTDGTVYVFGENAPLQAIRDRYGNTVTIQHANGQSGNITQVISPNGRWLKFSYDGSNRITQVTDNLGRTVGYTYNAAGCLATVTDPASNVTTYGYDASNRLTSITDGRSITYVTNVYDANGRVITQTLADPAAVAHLAYTTDGSGNVTETTITDPQGHVEQLAFNADRYIVSDTVAQGAPEERTTTIERQPATDLVTATTDGLGRRTEFTYDSAGAVLTTTRLAGTPEAVTTTFTYEPVFHQLATVTDPLSHTWTTTYDATGHLTGVTDPLQHHTTVALNTAGQVTSVTDALQDAWQFGYAGGDLVSTTNPVGASWTRFPDAAGRVVSTTDPLGRQTQTVFDSLNRPTTVTDPLGGETAFSYDPNSNLLALTDALTHTTNYTYDNFDRVGTRVDPLTHAESYQYDFNGNLTQTTDRKSQVTTRMYDALDRLTQVTYADTSTVTYTYDAGDRITAIVDSANGTITRTYDGLDRLTEEVTPQGTVDYTYDADGRRATMTVAGQPTVSYTYDDAHRLTSIAQGTAVVSLTYDEANRRSTLTYPNGIVATYGYDAANELTSLAYTLGGNAVGDLTYTYDLAGQRTAVGGSLARTGLPPALASATYDAANRIATWGATAFTYDLNGNLTNDGATAYTWNARNQLVSLSGAASASFLYDGIGRRRGKTIAGTTTNFLYDGVNFVQEQAGNGTPTANLLTGLGIDETFTRTDTAGTSALLADALGSTLELADSSGALQTHYTYEPFGSTTATGATSTNSAQFTGRENDGTGLYFLRARFYSPAFQRFIAEDPLGIAGGANLFAYAGNVPTAFIDPLGLKPKTCPTCPPVQNGGPSGSGPNGPGTNGPGGNGPDPKPPTSPDPNPNPDGQHPKLKKFAQCGALAMGINELPVSAIVLSCGLSGPGAPACIGTSVAAALVGLEILEATELAVCAVASQ